MSESGGVHQLSGGGGDDDDVDAVSSLRRRRRLSSAVLGSPSGPTSLSSVSRLSAADGAEVESAGWKEAVAPPTCSAGNNKNNECKNVLLKGFLGAFLIDIICKFYSQLEEFFSWPWLSVLLPAAGDEAALLVPLASPVALSALGGLRKTQQQISLVIFNHSELMKWSHLIKKNFITVSGRKKRWTELKRIKKSSVSIIQDFFPIF